jgi:predicted lipase
MKGLFFLNILAAASLNLSHGNNKFVLHRKQHRQLTKKFSPSRFSGIKKEAILESAYMIRDCYERKNTNDYVCDYVEINDVGLSLSNSTDLFISFRGTKTLKDWRVNLDADLSDDFCSPGMIHSGYLKEYEENKSMLKMIIETNQNKNVYISGHSAGSGLATLLCLDRNIRNMSPNICLITFGMPKIGDKEFCRFLSQSNINREHFVVRGDVVPFFPLRHEYAPCFSTRILGDDGGLTLNINKLFRIHGIDEYIKYIQTMN